MSIAVPSEYLQSLEDFLHLHFSKVPRYGAESDNRGQIKLLESVEYSLFSGGKRFRPSVGFLLADALKLSRKQAIPWLAAVECIHTYSLIHDDLPSMDNDSLRRGKPTNHIVYGEATALLAGDALLTEAFALISNHYSENPSVGLELVKILAQASGLSGMVGGQAMDLAQNLEQLNDEISDLIHHLKTGVLICSVTEGIASIATLPSEERSKITKFGSHLGFAFQLKDDLLDFEPETKDPKNKVCQLGLETTKKLLSLISKHAEDQIKFLGEASFPLVELINYNIQRTV